MKQINSVVWQCSTPSKSKDGFLYLDKYDINHLKRIHTKYSIEPETIDDVSVNYLLERSTQIKYIIKECDILLKPNGLFCLRITKNYEHGCYIRSLQQVMFEFSTSTFGRYVLEKKEEKSNTIILQFKKLHKTLPSHDRIDRWSFGIITGGNSAELVSTLIESIIKQDIPEYEILVCGYYEPTDSQKDKIALINDIKEKDIRGPIVKKKNKIVESASYNNLLILHDRYVLPDDWFDKITKYGNYFEILSMPNETKDGERISDWNEFTGFPSSRYRFDYLLPDYKRFPNYWYAQGGVLLVKKHLYDTFRLDNNLYWGELEDVQYSQIAHLKGALYYFDINNRLLTHSARLPKSKQNNSKFLKSLRLLKSMRKFYLQMIKNYINYKVNNGSKT